MRKALEEQYWALKDETTPAQSHLEGKLESMERKELILGREGRRRHQRP